MQKPSFWRVLVAYIIDSIILLCLSLMWWMLGAMGIDAVLKPSPFSLVVLLCVWGAITVVYFALLERKGRGSVGKQICKLKIQPSDVSFRRLFASYAVDYCLLVLIGMCVYACFIYFFL